MTDVLATMRRKAGARATLVVDEDGAVLASDGDANTPLLGQMAVDQLGGLDGLARVVDTPDFGVLFHDVRGEDVWASRLPGDRTLVVLFDQMQASLGTVRITVNALRDDLVQSLDSLDD